MPDWTELDELRAIAVNAAAAALDYPFLPETYIQAVNASVDALAAAAAFRPRTFTPEELRAAGKAMEDVDPVLALTPPTHGQTDDEDGEDEYVTMLRAALASLGLITASGT